jgi:hypothetical protein
MSTLNIMSLACHEVWLMLLGIVVSQFREELCLQTFTCCSLCLFLGHSASVCAPVTRAWRVGLHMHDASLQDLHTCI